MTDLVAFLVYGVTVLGESRLAELASSLRSIVPAREAILAAFPVAVMLSVRTQRRQRSKR